MREILSIIFSLKLSAIEEIKKNLHWAKKNKKTSKEFSAMRNKNI